jgi:hypothetical protein
VVSRNRPYEGASMKLSIYPKANFVPANKEQKREMALLASNPNVPKVLEVNTEEQLIDAISTYAWSPSIFSGVRLDENFVSADFMGIDVDNGLTISEAESRAQALGLACLCLPSPSHTEEHNKFRLVFPLAKTILSHADFDATWDWLLEKFPELDAQCSDEARWYAPSKLGDGFWQDGLFLMPQKAKAPDQDLAAINQNLVEVPENLNEIVALLYGKDRTKIPEAVEFFLTNAHTGLSGLWTNSLNSFAFSLALSGVDDMLIQEVAEQVAPEPLTKSDLYQIKRACRDGNRKRNESEGL